MRIALSISLSSHNSKFDRNNRKIRLRKREKEWEESWGGEEKVRESKGEKGRGEGELEIKREKGREKRLLIDFHFRVPS